VLHARSLPGSRCVYAVVMPHARLAWLVVVTSSVASADPALVVGVNGAVLPEVTNRYSGGLPGEPGESNAGPVAYGVGGLIEWNATSHVSLGFAPRYVMGIDAGGGANAAVDQLDLRLRVAVGERVGRAWRLYAFGAPGYSTLFLNEGTTGMSSAPGAFALELGIGAKYSYTRTLAVTAELGYQMTQAFGAIGIVGPGDEIRYGDNFVSLALGFVTPVL
jgi:hypothetical protein